MLQQRKTYEAPELFELGKAEALTLGAIGCAPDDAQCEKYEWPEEVEAY